MLITVDCGTTNMRLRLYRSDADCNIISAPLDETKYKTGVRDAVRVHSDNVLKETLALGIREILERNSLTESDIEAVVCSGTLSSHVGIYHIRRHSAIPPHIPSLSECRRSAEYRYFSFPE